MGKKPRFSVMFIIWFAFGALLAYMAGTAFGYWWLQEAYPSGWYFFNQ